MKSVFAEEEPAEMTYRKDSENIEAEARWTEEEPHRPPDELDTSENLVHLYLSETRRTPMLTGHEEKRLGSIIEQDKYLTQIEQEMTNKLDHDPSSVDILFALLDGFCRESALFDALCKYFEIPEDEPIVSRASNSRLIHNIDGYIEPQLVNTISGIINENPEQTLRALIQLPATTCAWRRARA